MSIITTTLNKLGIGGGSDTTTDEEHDEQINDVEEGSSEVSNPSNYFAPEDAVWYKDKVVVNGKHARTYAIDAWPPAPRRNMFQELIMDANIDYDFAIHYEPYGDSVAIDKLDEIADDLNDKHTGDFARFIPDTGALEETEKVVNVMKRYINEGESMFDISFFVTVYADSEDELHDIHKKITDDLVRGANVSITKNSLRQKQAMQSCSPAAKNVLGDDRDQLKQKMLGSAAAQTYPFVQDTFMEEGGVMFGINEESMTPVIVDIFNRRNGYNMITSGMIGAGKSFSSSQVLLSMDAAYQDFQQFIIDPMGGFAGVNHCLDGDRIVINGQEKMNPMRLEETPESVIEESEGKLDPWSMKKAELKYFLSTFFEMVGNNQDSLSNEELSTLDRAITKTYHKKGITQDISTHHKESPTIMDLIETLEDMSQNTEEYTSTNEDRELERRKDIAVDLVIALDPFKPGGEYHNLAQQSELDISGERTIYLDLSQIPENSDDLGIMMKLLFMQIYQEAKQTDNKVAMTIDEAHKIFRDSGITDGLEEMFRHSRHFDLSINLISQTPEEFYATETAQTISKQCTIKRFHRVDKLNDEVAKEILDMNEEEINYIENAEMGEGDKDYSQALLRISDEDRSIPLQIYATKDEAMVIDYEASEDVDDYNDPAARDLKQALDTKNKTESIHAGGSRDDLTQKVRSAIAKKEDNKREVIEEEIRREISEQIEENEDDEDESIVADSEPTLAEPDADVNVNEDGDRYANLRRRLKEPERVDDRSESEIEMIVGRHDIGSEDESIETLRARIKREVFDVDVDIEALKEANNTTPTDNNESTNGNGSGSVDVEITDPATEESPTTGDDTGANTETSEGSGDNNTDNTDNTSTNGGVADIEQVEEFDADTVDTMYMQYIGGGDDLSTEQKREELKSEFGE